MTNEEMSLKTKQRLAEALKSALQKKKLSKVTVSELVAACDINRKTFYYHFEDIYALFKWMLEQEAIKVINQFDFIVDTEEALRFIIDYVDSNKHMINGAYDSVGPEEIKRFLYNDLISVFEGVIEQGESLHKIHLEAEFKRFLAAFYTEACAGLIIMWVKDQLNIDKEEVLQNLLFIFKNSMPAVMKATQDI